MNPSCRVIVGDALTELRKLPDESVQCCVTSVPYWQMRDYKMPGQIGLEKTVFDWIAALVAVFEETRRVLKKDGVLWLNCGDCFAGGGNGGGGSFAKDGVHAADDADKNVASRRDGRGVRGIFKPKDMVGQPWRLAFALHEAGWWLRRDIIWEKPNASPETVYDRPTTAHEYIFLLTKSAKYYYDDTAIREPVTGNSHASGDGVNAKIKSPDGWDTADGAHGSINRNGRSAGEYRPRQNPSWSAAMAGIPQTETRNCRSVWSIPTEPYRGAHFATFPTALPRRCILAGTRLGDTVIDPFAGTGTTCAVALGLGRSSIAIELNPDYADMIHARIANQTLGLPL